MKIHLKIIFAFIIALFLAACGTSNKDSEDNSNSNGGIVEGEMKTSIEEKDSNQYTLIIQNDKTKEETLTFNSSQDYEYQIKKPDGTVAYTYSADKMFMAVVEEEVLKPGERLKFTLDVSEAFPYLEAGDYTLEAWVTADGIDDKKVSVDFAYNGT